ncbi:unnamed protein product [Caretta caretta]
MDTNQKESCAKCSASWSWECRQIFDNLWCQVLGAALSTELLVVHDDLISWDGNLVAPESSMESDGSQKQMSNEAREENLLLTPVPEEALPQEQL